MFGSLGGPELILILVIALIVFGPRRLPDIGKSVGKMLVEFRRASNDFKRTIEDEVESERRALGTQPGPGGGAAAPAADAPPPQVVPAAAPIPPAQPAAQSPAGAEGAAAPSEPGEQLEGARPLPAGTVAQAGAARASSSDPA